MPQITIQQAFDLALEHHQAGRLREAEQLYRQILAQQPQHAEALHNLGVMALHLGRNDMAIDLLRRAIAAKPNFPEAYTNLGNCLKALGRWEEAIAACRQAVALQPGYAVAQSNLGHALQAGGRMDEAIAAWRQAVDINPGFAEAHNSLGAALQATGHWDAAIAAHRRAIILMPNNAEAHGNLGAALQATGSLDEAVAACRQAVALKPNYPEAYCNLGSVLAAQERFDEAIAAFRQAIALTPKFAEAHCNLGNALWRQGHLDQAIAAYRQAIALMPDYAEAHATLALGLLAQGDFAQGWAEYEWRWRRPDFHLARRDFAQPRWDGGRLDGRTLLLHAEQGFGDTLQFIRYLPLVAQRGGRIIIECQPELQRMIQTMAGDIPVLAKGQPLPAFDVQCPLLSLPHALGTTLANIPGKVPYLHAEVRNEEIWRTRLEDSSSTKVGLVWAGNPTHQNDANRSVKLASLAALARVPGVQFFSLQKGAAAAEAKTPPPGMELLDFTAELKNFADTAALIAHLDLVLAVDTAVAHLAAAMGKEVWMLLPHVADWRWLRNRADSPWYPTLRLFRQPTRGDWASVITRVAQALADWIENRT